MARTKGSSTNFRARELSVLLDEIDRVKPRRSAHWDNVATNYNAEMRRHTLPERDTLSLKRKYASLYLARPSKEHPADSEEVLRARRIHEVIGSRDPEDESVTDNGDHRGDENMADVSGHGLHPSTQQHHNISNNHSHSTRGFISRMNEIDQDLAFLNDPNHNHDHNQHQVPRHNNTATPASADSNTRSSSAQHRTGTSHAQHPTTIPSNPRRSASNRTSHRQSTIDTSVIDDSLLDPSKQINTAYIHMALQQITTSLAQLPHVNAQLAQLTQTVADLKATVQNAQLQQGLMGHMWHGVNRGVTIPENHDHQRD